jgi:hypothetical protein
MRLKELYGVTPTKGEFRNSTLLISFDAVRECAGEECEIFEKCPYVKTGRCLVEKKYLQAVFKTMVETLGPRHRLTQLLLNKITLHLLPLFHQLIRMQIIAYGVSDVCQYLANGSIKVHPVFKEIRDILQKIEATQKSMGLEGEYLMSLGLGAGGRAAVQKGRMREEHYGDDSYWEELNEGMEAEMFEGGVKREVRRAKRQIEAEEWEDVDELELMGEDDDD